MARAGWNREESGRADPVTVMSAEIEDTPTYAANGIERCIHWVSSEDAASAEPELVALARQLRLTP